MANFVRIGPHIVAKSDISHINKATSCSGGSAKSVIICRFYNGTTLNVEFESLSDLAHTFNRLVMELT